MHEIDIKVEVPFKTCSGCRNLNIEQTGIFTDLGETPYRFIYRCENEKMCRNAVRLARKALHEEEGVK